MRKITPKKYAISLYEASKDASKPALKGLVKNFITILARSKQLSQADKIIKAFRHYAHQEENIIDVMITSTESVNDAVRQDIIKKLEKSLGKKVVLHESVDPSLVGGMVVQYGDTVIDGSVINRLDQLSQSLTK